MAPPPGGDQGGSSLMSTLLMFVLIIAIFYFLMLRPQQKRQKERQKLLDSVKKGDRVITSGGMYGTIAGIDDKTLLIEVADKVKVKFERSAVATILREAEPDPQEKK
jgi:preprotein translocase subunit YajC